MRRYDSDDHARSRAHDLLDRALRPGAIRAVFQPIVRLRGGDTIGYEALSRFDVEPEAAPDGSIAEVPDTQGWFELASELDRRVELEVASWEAISAAGAPPDGGLLFVNTSPAALADPRVRSARDLLPPRVVLELSEHDAVADYDALRTVLAEWTVRGDRLAIDDAGAGYASLRHVLQLAPDYVKLDRSLISGIDHDPNRRALAAALVAYGRDVGTSIIAEGVERGEEMLVLRSAGVGLAQGYLLARPDAPWPTTEWRPRSVAADHDVRGLARFQFHLGSAVDARAACEAAADYLARTGDLMPSVYLERGGLLRCQAQRGLWQVLDGMPPDAGITGRTFRTGSQVTLEDRDADADYLEAIPGVVAEACEPIRMDDVVVGALNIESFEPLTEAAMRDLERCAALLGERLRVIGGSPHEGATQRLARHAARLTESAEPAELERRICDAACDVSSMDSAFLALADPAGELVLRARRGPLSEVFARLDPTELGRLARLVESVASCYSAGETNGVCVTAAEALRAAGVRSIVVVPLGAREQRRGILVVASTAPTAIHTEDVEPLELLVSAATMALETAGLVGRLRARAVTDPLTGLGNHSAFHSALAGLIDRSSTRSDSGGDGADVDVDVDVDVAAEVPAVLMIDLDNFKAVNDTAGHLAGDQVLREVASAMSDTLRSSDRLYRVGGDEFAAILLRTSSSMLDEIGRRLVQAVLPVLDRHGGGVSIGAAIVGEGESAEQVLHRADESLYLAKRTGGSQLRMVG